MNLNDTVWELDGESGNFGWFVKRYIEKLVEEKFTSTNSAMDAIAELAERFILSNKCDESVSIMLRCFAEYVRQQHQ